MSEEISEAHYQAVLEKRAQALAQAPKTLGERRLICTVALVGIGPEVFGVPVTGLREIVRAPPLTPLPGLPAWLPGIVQIRGEILSAVHMARWLGIAESAPPQYLAVLEGFELPLGLLVGSVLAFRDIWAEDLASGLSEDERGQRPVSGTTRDLVSILDLEALVRSPDLRLGASRQGELRGFRNPSAACERTEKAT
ncbi:MAG: chemotaxis protein CheW [Deltaproteobacteria bacterium]|nr:chemotaxis protein CheW [Deltaproteobacteria bacterium]